MFCILALPTTWRSTWLTASYHQSLHQSVEEAVSSALATLTCCPEFDPISIGRVVQSHQVLHSRRHEVVWSGQFGRRGVTSRVPVANVSRIQPNECLKGKANVLGRITSTSTFQSLGVPRPHEEGWTDSVHRGRPAEERRNVLVAIYGGISVQPLFAAIPHCVEALVRAARRIIRRTKQVTDRAGHRRDETTGVARGEVRVCA